MIERIDVLRMPRHRYCNPMSSIFLFRKLPFGKLKLLVSVPFSFPLTILLCRSSSIRNSISHREVYEAETWHARWSLAIALFFRFELNAHSVVYFYFLLRASCTSNFPPIVRLHHSRISIEFM